jgi:OOP family OmpA-OmpF porin
MKINLVDSVDFCFTGSVIAQLSTLVDETEPGIERALQQAVPLVMNDLAARIGHGLTPDGLLALMHDADDANVLEQLATPAMPQSYERGTNLLLDLLGERYRSTVNQLAVDAGIRPTASGTLLQVAATAVMGVLGRIATENHFSATDFVYWLHAQKASVGAAMLPLRPPETGATAPGHQLMRRATAVMSLDPAADDEPAATGSSAMRWQWGALLLVTVCLGYLFGHGLLNPASPALPPATPLAAGASAPAAGPTPPEAAATPEAPVPAPLAAETPPAPAAISTPTSTSAAVRAPSLASASPTAVAAARAARRPAASARTSGGRYDQDRDTYIYDTGRPIKLTLADGATQKVGANSTENRLYTFLASPDIQVDSVNRTKGWINFDRINFEAGKALLTPESALQLGNIASILATFPDAMVKFGGYTDSTGTALNNFQLSEDRARTAMLTLTSMGVSPERLQAKGYGPKYFVSPNNTPTERALNRRVSIRVVRK